MPSGYNVCVCVCVCADIYIYTHTHRKVQKRYMILQSYIRNRGAQQMEMIEAPAEPAGFHDHERTYQKGP